jgi:arylsulfatase A-like enzyme
MDGDKVPAPIIARRQLFGLSAAALLAAGGAGAYRRKQSSERPNIVIYLADTLRADHVGCYGYRLNTTPNIDRLAHRSLIFNRCYATAPWTKPSVASLLTGVLPAVHQAVLTTFDVPSLTTAPVQNLRDSFRTFPELLADHGYHSSVFQTNPHLQRELGFARGFQEYSYQLAQPPDAQMDAVLEYLRAEAQEPFCLYVHGIDPHAPYEPRPQDFLKLHGHSLEDAEASLSEHDRNIVHAHLRLYERREGEPVAALHALSAHGVDHQRQRYDGEIFGVDHQFGRLLAYLEQNDLLRRTVVLMVSDHGEAFGEHGYFGHGNSLHDEEIRVPLILHVPDGPVGLQVPYTVSLCDVYPTLATLAGVKWPDYVQGRPLLTRGRELAVEGDEAVFASRDDRTDNTADWDVAMIEGSSKVMATEAGGQYAAYDTSIDPGEQQNLLTLDASDSTRARRLVASMKHQRNEHLTLAERFGPPEWLNVDRDYRQQLESLGYL